MVHVDVEVELVDLNEVDLVVDSDDAPQYHVEVDQLVDMLAQCSERQCFSLRALGRSAGRSCYSDGLSQNGSGRNTNMQCEKVN